MDLNIDYLLKRLSDNPQEILEKIHNDPKLTKRQCPETGLYIANAAKDLFTPTHEHQLYAKGIIYSAKEHNEGPVGIYTEFKLVSLGYLKIYNFEENQLVDQHISEMLKLGANPVFTMKMDGTCIMRFVYDDKVYLATRGMIETMAETDEQKKFFEWARKIIAEKYPKIDSQTILSGGTSLFELVGPGNQIVTSYREWDLVMTGYIKTKSVIIDGLEFLKDIYYWGHEFLWEYCNSRGYANPVSNLPLSGETIKEKIESLNNLFGCTDEEGSVIQFELYDETTGRTRVAGRVKAKTDTYRKLLKLMNGCDFKSISALIKSDMTRFSTWSNFKSYLMSLGNAQYPEELMQSYEQLFNDFWEHNKNCYKFFLMISAIVDRILDSNNIKFSYDENWNYSLDKKARSQFAFAVENHPYKSQLFQKLDNKLTVEVIRDKLFLELEDSIEAIRNLGEK